MSKAITKAQNHGKLSMPERRVKIALLISYLALGLQDTEIIEKMSLASVKELNTLKQWVYEQETERSTNKTAPELFVDYSIAQTAIIDDLGKIVETLKSSNQGNAAVGALRAKSDILDKIVKRGTELGVLEKGKGKFIPTLIGGIDVSSMSHIDIAIRIRKELTDIDRLVGDQIIDIPAEAVITRRKAPAISAGDSENNSEQDISADSEQNIIIDLDAPIRAAV